MYVRIISSTTNILVGPVIFTLGVCAGEVTLGERRDYNVDVSRSMRANAQAHRAV